LVAGGGMLNDAGVLGSTILLSSNDREGMVDAFSAACGNSGAYRWEPQKDDENSRIVDRWHVDRRV